MLGAGFRRAGRSGPPGGRAAEYVEADAATRPMVSRRQPSSLAALLAFSSVATEGADGRHCDAGIWASNGSSHSLTGGAGKMVINELAYMSAAETAERVRRRSLSPVEIVDSCIAR